MTPTLQKADIEDADFYKDTLKALNTASNTQLRILSLIVPLSTNC